MEEEKGYTYQTISNAYEEFKRLMVLHDRMNTKGYLDKQDRIEWDRRLMGVDRFFREAIGT